MRQRKLKTSNLQTNTKPTTNELSNIMTTNDNWTEIGFIPLYETDTSTGRLVASRGKDGGVSLRVFTETATYDGPTKKGFVVPAEQLAALRELLV